MSEKLCIVCGFSNYEVEKMHKFPTNEQKSKIWQESMGMVYVPGISLRNYNICSRHFSEECYRSLLTRKLLPNAIPTLFPCTVQTQEAIMQVSDMEELSGSTNIGELVTEDPIPSCSGLQERTTTPVSHRQFRGIEDVSYSTTTPKKQRLIRMVKNKEAHIRKLKRICKLKANNIKSLTNLEESPVVKNLFKGMSSTTADFLISQLRCARRAPHEELWLFHQKIHF
ncbi:uncharacterized protein LOC111691339 [Anoplophora glabripennis]|uniref:uncharacterized protein LOC111691339 n=1 Tax=Anoplophora glabripennis TaxID=217634 RepID=UPI000C7946B9|nr:uncharacterized protein LOC111691339 [Anoplophora glabripennis]